MTNNGADAELLRNEQTSRGQSLVVRLVGVGSNRSAVGARLRVTAGGKTYVREVKAGSSYLGQNDLRQHVGLGSAAMAERVEVRWPNSVVESVAGVSAGQLVTITEGKGITGRVPFRK